MNIFSFFFIGFLSFVVISCSPSQEIPAQEVQTVSSEHEQSRFHVPEQPLRIITLIPSATELVFALGSGENVVARSQFSDFPAEVSELPSVGSGLALDVETILTHRPTLLIGSQIQTDLAEIEVLRQSGIEVLLLPDQSSADVQHAIITLGNRLDQEALAETINQRLLVGIQSIIQAAQNETPISTLVATGIDPIFAAGPESFIGELLPLIKSENVLTEGEWVQMDEESLITSAPEVIIVIGEESSENAWARFETVPAVINERICYVDPNLAGRPGPRLHEGLREIYRCIHP